jgi:hypothetical protein
MLQLPLSFLYQVLSLVDIHDLREMASVSRRIRASVEQLCGDRLLADPRLMGLLPQGLRCPRGTAFGNYYSSITYWIDLPCYALGTTPELLRGRVGFPHHFSPARRLLYCSLWVEQMSEYQQLLLLSEFDAVWPGPHRFLEELLPPSVLIEVESLSELSMAIQVIDEAVDVWNNFEEGDFREEIVFAGDFEWDGFGEEIVFAGDFEEEGDFGEEDGDLEVIDFDPWLYQLYPRCYGS